MGYSDIGVWSFREFLLNVRCDAFDGEFAGFVWNFETARVLIFVSFLGNSVR
jgi:hypothetical protein